MLSLKSFHVFFISLSIVLTSALGFWELLNNSWVIGTVSLTASILLVFYEGYFVKKTQRMHLD
jgi:uncharacterized membrane protein SirB2